MTPTIKISPCEMPPVKHAKPGKWWHYEVITASGRNQCSGYVPGARSDAQRVTRRHLEHMELLEGSHAPRLVVIETQRVTKHSEATPWRKWSSHERDPDIHDELCRCRSCSQAREKRSANRRHNLASRGSQRSALLVSKRKRKARA